MRPGNNWGKSFQETLSEKQKQKCGVAQAEEHLLSKPEALSSNPILKKKKGRYLQASKPSRSLTWETHR
jgi:hypothetical protein